jgi:hypoxanthine phosphoribosyltransferase
MIPAADFPLDEAQIARRVNALGLDVAAAIPASEPLIVIGLLRACFVFVADLARAIPRPIEVEFISARSYAGNTSSGNVAIDNASASLIDVAGKHVVLVDTMLDHGLTLTAAAALFRNREARSVSACLLLRKPHSPRNIVDHEFIGFDVPDKYAVGYGLDSNGHYRNQRFVSAIETQT